MWWPITLMEEFICHKENRITMKPCLNKAKSHHFLYYQQSTWLFWLFMHESVADMTKIGVVGSIHHQTMTSKSSINLFYVALQRMLSLSGYFALLEWYMLCVEGLQQKWSKYMMSALTILELHKTWSCKMRIDISLQTWDMLCTLKAILLSSLSHRLRTCVSPWSEMDALELIKFCAPLIYPKMPPPPCYYKCLLYSCYLHGSHDVV